MPLKKKPEVRVQMLIHKPMAEVFEALVNPEHTTKFWYTRSSGKMEAGASLRWDWEMYDVGADVRVLEIEPEQRIFFEWGDPPTKVEWRFEAYEDNTLLMIRNWGFHGDEDSQVAQALDSTGGFTTMLAGAKVYLEHGIHFNLVADNNPS